MTGVSIVVPCRNEGRHIGRFLDSLLNQDFNAIDWEVIVADGMSNDGTRAVLEERSLLHPGRIRIIDNPEKIVSTGLNAAIRQARGEIVMRMDIHTEYAPDYVTECLAAIETAGAQNVGGPARTKAHGYVGRAIAAAYHSRFACGGALFHNDAYEGYVDTVTYGCWRKSTLLDLGLFDEALVRNQDDELNLRLVRAGGKIWQTPRIVSWYSPRPKLSQLFRQYFQYGFWKVPVIRKHRIPASWRHLIPVAFVVANLVLLVAAAVEFGATRGTWALRLWLAMIAAYCAGCLAASFSAARRFGWDLLPLLPLVFATYHSSYGLGFFAGLIHWRKKALSAETPAAIFSEISR